MARVRRGVEPMQEAAAASLGAADSVDASAVDLPLGTTAVEFTTAALGAAPRWVERLLSLRDLLVRPFGLRRTAPAGPGGLRLEPGQRVGPFVVFAVDDAEVLLGDDDTHLGFRTSFAVRPRSGGAEGVCTTVVRYDNAFGRAYFTVIRPFHHLVVAALLGRCRP